MNPFEFVIALIFMTFVFRIISHRMGMRTGLDRRWANQQLEAGDPRETARLRDEVQELKQRIQVLERITVDKENSLAKEIESLRDR
jgi:cell division protein FtsB